MIKFTTETGSVYELDRHKQLIRRVSGNHPVTRNQRAEGEWRHYENLALWGPGYGEVIRAPRAGERLMIVWGNEPETPDVLRRTLTSMVTRVDAVAG